MKDNKNWYEIELKKEALELTIQNLKEKYCDSILGDIKKSFIFQKGVNYEESINQIRRRLESLPIERSLVEEIFLEYQKNIGLVNNEKYSSESFLDMHQFEREYANDEPWPSHMKRLAQKVGIKDEMTLLNVGINDGQEMEGLENKIIGIDLSDKAMQKGIDKYPNMSFVKGSANDLPIESNSMDVYISFRTLCVTGIYESRALSEAKRVLKDGGLILISIPSVNYDKGDTLNKGKYNIEPCKRNDFNEEAKRFYDLLENKGFVDLRAYKNGVEDFILGVKK